MADITRLGSFKRTRTKIMTTDTLKVLIADDSELLRKRLIFLLSEVQQVQIIGEATTATEAIQQIQQGQPDVLILDLRMSGSNGLDVLQWLRQAGLTTIVLIFTTFAYPQYRERCLAAGADYFFDKAEEFEQLKELVRKLAGQASPSALLSNKAC